MAVNSLAPGFVKLFIQDALFIHDHTIGVNLVQPLPVGEPQVLSTDGTSYDWADAVDAFVTVIRPVMSPTSTILYAELWSKPTATDDPVFVSIHDIGLAGTGSTGGFGYNQITFSYRTAGGNNGKIVLFNIPFALNSIHRPPGYTNSTFLAVANYIKSNANVVYGRDNTYPVIVSKALTKTNDALRKRSLVDI